LRRTFNLLEHDKPGPALASIGRAGGGRADVAGRARQPRRIVIVGAGLAGTATAIRLLQFAREPAEIVLVERRPEYRSAGVAYHPESNPWQHVFNIQAGRMSVFREDVDDFVNWANREADRSGWSLEWRGFTFTESGPAPRRIYPSYLADRLARAAREASDGVTLIEADREVVDLEVQAGQVEVVLEARAPSAGSTRPRRATLIADHVILATGLERKRPAWAAGVVDHPSFVKLPYSPAGAERILGARPDAVVAIVGTTLSAYDSAALLLRRGHAGKIHMISGSGLTLRTYPSQHRHRVLTLPPPGPGGDTWQGREEFTRCVRSEWDRACAVVASEHPEEAAVVAERVLKSWEPHLPEILAGIPAADLRALLDRYGSLVARLRVGVMPYTAEVVEAAMTMGGQVTVTRGRVEGIRGTEAGTLVLSIAGPAPAPPQSIEADLVISNFGRESDYERVDSRLWANLLRKGTASVHHRTERGIEVDAWGNLVGSSGEQSGPISVVGGPREGDEIVRNGRMGAFTFNLAAIKNHSIEVAALVLCRLEDGYDEAAVTLAKAQAPELAAAISRSIIHDVHRMTARSRDNRQALAALLEDSLQEIQEITIRSGGAPLTDRALRTAVTRAAVARLNDTSVTPRDLRSSLGLERRREIGDSGHIANEE
jgi:uncharacterized NAD(P)/FAD-binding protein YdhS